MILTAFFGLLLISSCTCNNENEPVVTNEDTMMNTEGMNGTINNATTSAETNDAEWQKIRNMFDENNYTRQQIEDYRKMHDEMDWGNVPGFYPEASTRQLTTNDTKFLTEWGHTVMLNEIYARHGMRFTDEDLKDHFGRQEWYKPTHDDVTSMLTAQERDNITFLQNHPA